MNEEIKEVEEVVKKTYQSLKERMIAKSLWAYCKANCTDLCDVQIECCDDYKKFNSLIEEL
ncbi:MAG: hypothetical protein MJZ30_09600 [Paludibacteraceae bacterium]|nr:hypothetical protein [Paludibacteraceae bacterium]